MEAEDPTEIQLAARELAERSAREQGLPARITDRATLERVATIVRGAKEGSK